MLARPSRLTVTGAPAARLSRSRRPVALPDATVWSRLLPLCGGLAGLTSFGCVRIAPNSCPPRVPRGRSTVGSSTSELVIRLVRTVQPLLGPPLLTKSLPPPSRSWGVEWWLLCLLPSQGRQDSISAYLGWTLSAAPSNAGAFRTDEGSSVTRPPFSAPRFSRARPAILTPQGRNGF